MRCHKCAALMFAERSATADGSIVFHDNMESMIREARNGCDLCRLFVFNARIRVQQGTGVDLSTTTPAAGILRLRREAESEDAFGSSYPRVVCHSLDEFGAEIEVSIAPESFRAQREGQAVSLFAESGRCAVLQTWLQVCLREHKSYMRGRALVRQTKVMPSRVIEITGTDDQVRYRLVENIDDGVQYAALSYRWGDAAHAKGTTIINYKERLEAISDTDLTKTWKDAVDMCNALAVRYLWIDALCIIQPTGPDDDTDWQAESAKMGQIYESALFVIAATSSFSSSEGCFPTSDEAFGASIPPPCLLLQHEQSYGIELLPYYPNWSNTIEKSPLQDRAWVLQEYCMSQRIIHCTKYGAFWQCSQIRAHESIPWVQYDVSDGVLVSQPEMVPRQSMIKNTSLLFAGEADTAQKRHMLTDYWQTVARDYARRDLTQEGDRFPALSAIARRVAVLTKDRYLAGIWQSQVLDQLLWSYTYASGDVESFERRITSNTRYLPQFRRYIGPSWSWISHCHQFLKGHADLHFQIGQAKSQSYHATLAGVNITPVFDGNPYGQILEGASIRLRTKVVQFTDEAADRARKASLRDRSRHIDSSPAFDYQASLCNVRDSYFVVIRVDDYRVAQSSPTHRCLVVSPVDADFSAFRRIGNCSWANDDFFDQAVEREIDLV